MKTNWAGAEGVRTRSTRQPAVQELRRRRKLSPVVVGACLLMMLATGMTLVSVPALALPCVPAGSSSNETTTGPQPDCGGGGGGGGCPGGIVGIGLDSLTNNPTNVSVKFTLSTNATVYFYWGTSPSYGYTAIDGLRYNYGELTQTAFVDYLNPSTTYYFEIVASTYCMQTGYYSSSWTSVSEQSYLNVWGATIQGRVLDTAGFAAPADTTVLVHCTDLAASQGWVAQAYTSSNGAYSINVGHLGQPYCTSLGFGYFVVQVANGIYVGTNVWANHWNETIVVWAPQFVNFYVDIAGLSSPNQPVVTELDFTHTSSALVSSCTSESSSWEYEADSSISGSLFGVSFDYTSSTVTSSSTSSTGCIQDQSEPGLETWGEVQTAGMVVFDAVDGRTTSIPWEQSYNGIANGGNAGIGSASGAPIQEWLTEPTTLSQACTIGGVQWLDFPVVPHTQDVTETLTVAGSESQLSGETWGASAPLVMDGVQVGTLEFSNGFTIQSSQSYQFDASVTFLPSTVTQYFTIACTGGDPASSTGIVLHVWQDS